MTTGVKVIASFNEKGDIYPLWIKVGCGEKYFTYKVKESKQISSGNPKWVRSLTYHCVVQQENRNGERELNLEYSIQTHSWRTTANNSIFYLDN